MQKVVFVIPTGEKPTRGRIYCTIGEEVLELWRWRESNPRPGQ